MKINKNNEVFILIILFLITFAFWTLPFQENPIPYGEVDAASHYALAEYAFQEDTSITDLPYYIDQRYGRDNKFKNNILWYPPPFHTALALSAIAAGTPDVPIYLLNAILSSLIILSVYFLIRKLYGIQIAFPAALLLIFSMRDILIYIWGQWPERMGFAYVPLALYCCYAYTESYLKNNPKNIYLYLLATTLAINFFIHPMDFFHTLAAVSIYTLFLTIKERKWCFNTKLLAISIVVFFLIISIFPAQTLNVFVRLKVDSTAEQPATGEISRLFHWFKAQPDNPGVPQSYFSYEQMIAPIWTIPLIWLGIIALCLRRKRKDLLMLAWLVSLYIMIHLDFIGKGRVHRSLSASSHLFYPLMILGIWYVASLIPAAKNLKPLIRYGSITLITFLMLLAIAPPATKALKGAYEGISRISPEQYNLITFLKESNIPEDAEIRHLGSISLAKTRWIFMAGHRTTRDRGELEKFDYLIFDYSDIQHLGDPQAIQNLVQLEQQLNATPIYESNKIRLYKR